MTRATALAAAVLLLAGFLYAIGFAGFEAMARRTDPDPGHADGIVALTGGADRIETALHLLEEGHAPALLVSGLGRGADMPELARRVPLTADEADRITLGRVATTTVGNAEETASWARARAMRTLIVVTAGYHMPRALIEIGRALPGVTLIPVSVRPPALRGGLEAATVRMMANEFDKYLAVRLGLTRWKTHP